MKTIRHWKTQNVPISPDEAIKTRGLKLREIEERIEELRNELTEMAMSDLPTTKSVMVECDESEATYSDQLVTGPRFIRDGDKWKPEDKK